LSETEPMLLDAGPIPLRVGPVFVSFEVTGKPGHKGRHRDRIVFPTDRKKKPFVHHYPDPDTEAYEKILREVAGLHMRGRQPTENPVAMIVHVFREVPKSWSDKDRRRALAGAILPTPKPDADNHSKIVDALNGVVWKDDSQVCDWRTIKRYDARPGWRIEVREFLPLPE
jgi:Holliday junction resolvase RusA-like endonuclease